MASRTVACLALGSLVACAPEAAAPSPDHHHHHGGPLVHRFENAAQWAKQFDDPARDAWQRPADVIAAMKITPGMTVADLGAGTGYFLPHLARATGPKGKVIALDVEPDMVRYMSERAAREGLANVEARVVPFHDPALPAGSVDRILVVDTWHHIDGRPAYAGKLRDALSPGGAVFVVDFKRDAHFGPPPEHRLAPEQVMDELRGGGLDAQLVPAGLPEQYIVAGWRR
ncbi:MAG: class I SAM-dependent methyltransferase [Minicystis sp.]